MKIAILNLALLLFLSLVSSAHVAEQFYSSFDQEKGVLKVNFDVGYAIPETRDDPNGPQPKRGWLLTRSEGEHEKLRREAKVYLRDYISFVSNGQDVSYEIKFPDFDTSPPIFPELLNEGAYYNTELTPSKIGAGVSVRVMGEDSPKLVVAIRGGEEMEFHVLEEKDNPLMLGKSSDFIPVESSSIKRYSAFVDIGFRHVIPEGADHILFIIGICLSAHGFRNLLAQSLVFTFAHSISMALVISGWLPVYSYGISAWIEPVIALSISFLALEAFLQRKNGKFRYAIIGSFGFIHGLGFAGSMGSSLQAITPDGGHWITALVWANLGIELAQALLILIVFGLFYTMSKSNINYLNNTLPMKKILALIIGIVGLVWFIQRL